MLDLEPEAGVKLLGQPLPMAMGRVAFVAQEAQRSARSCDRGFRQRRQLVEFVLRLRGLQVALENAQHLVGMTAARCEPALFGRAEPLQVQIADAALIESRGKLAFRKPRPPRCRHGAHIDQEPDARLCQRVKKRVRCRLLVADGEQPFHDGISLSSRSPRITRPRRRRACPGDDEHPMPFSVPWDTSIQWG
jgi:hypothetical protein